MHGQFVFVLIFEHRHGRGITAYGTYQKAESALLEIVTENWQFRADKEAPQNPSSCLDNGAVIAAYFEGHGEDSYAIEKLEVK